MAKDFFEVSKVNSTAGSIIKAFRKNFKVTLQGAFQAHRDS